jgi:DNA-directed RNA polymerase subunit M/transcription elongation factor TFIIS
MAFCSNCGTPLNEGSGICSKCGNSQTAPAQLTQPRLTIDREQIAVASQIATGAAASMQYQTAIQRQCPQCTHLMIVVFRRARSPWILFVFGVLITPIPLLGWVGGPCLIIVSLILLFTRKGKARYQCPNCNYAT